MVENEGNLQHKRWLLSLFGSLMILVFLLYLLTPSPNPSPLLEPNTSHLSGFVFVQVFLSLSIAIFVFLALYFEVSKTTIIIGSTMIMFSTTIGHQFGVASPIGADGWFFLELSRIHFELGSVSNIDSYLSRPGALFLIEWVWYFTPSFAPFLVALEGMVLSFCLFFLLTSALVRYSDEGHKWVPVASAGFSGLFLSGWNPSQFSAQLVALVVFFWLIHQQVSAGAHKKYSVNLAIIFLVMTHLITPLALLFVLIVEGFYRDGRAEASRWMACSTFFWFGLWALTFSKDATIGLLSRVGLEFPMVVFVISFVVGFSALYYWAKSFNDATTSEGVGVRMKSLLIGVFIFTPILIAGSLNLDVGSFLPRVFIFLFVPIGYGLIHIPNKIGFDSLLSKCNFRTHVAFIVAIGLIVGGSMGIAHKCWVERSLVMPKETLECWGAVEEAGVWNLVDDEGERWFVLHSPQLRPSASNPDERFYFDSLGEGDDRSIERVGAVIMTVDMEMRANRDGYTTEWMNWSVVGGVEGACKIVVRPTLVGELASSVT